MTYTEAEDEIFGIFQAAWNSACDTVLGLAQPAEIRWIGATKKGTPDETIFYAVPSYQGVLDSQAAMTAIDTTQLSDCTGLFYAQIFCPKSRRDGLSLGKLVAQVIRTAFRAQSPSGNVWFRNQTIKPVLIGQDNYVVTVVVTCQYTDVTRPVTELASVAVARYSDGNWFDPNSGNILFTNVNKDTAKAFNLATGAYTVPFTGTYSVTADTEWTGVVTPDQQYEVVVVIDGQGPIAAASQTSLKDGANRIYLSTDYDFTVGDVVSLSVQLPALFVLKKATLQLTYKAAA